MSDSFSVFPGSLLYIDLHFAVSALVVVKGRQIICTLKTDFFNYSQPRPEKVARAADKASLSLSCNVGRGCMFAVSLSPALINIPRYIAEVECSGRFLDLGRENPTCSRAPCSRCTTILLGIPWVFPWKAQGNRQLILSSRTLISTRMPLGPPSHADTPF
ncbi:hypothetical protein PLICRDRAFT_263326 [Plicaturopsis crispa FD-325 SS-3]|nr:hypothetical protein PLICRDRAFT_263326 [Plicaturopsis crispa FD-325 SS-3]